MSLPFDLRQLHYFVAVAEEESFRKAAERLHLSQPPLSRQIKQLEEALGATLFERNTGGVSLTLAGRALLPKARRLLLDAHALSGIAQSVIEESPVTKVGVTIAILPDTLAPLVTLWQKVVPRLTARSGYTGELLAALAKHQLDLAFIGLPAETTGLELQVVDREPLYLALPTGHPAARKRTPSLKDLAELPLFWWPRSHNPAYHDHCWRHFRALNFTPDVIEVEPGQFLTHERIARGEGFTLLNLGRKHAGVKGMTLRPFKESTRFEIQVAAAWWPGKTSETAQQLADIAKTQLASVRQARDASSRDARSDYPAKETPPSARTLAPEPA